MTQTPPPSRMPSPPASTATLIDSLTTDLTPVRPMTTGGLVNVAGLGVAFSVVVVALVDGLRADLVLALMTPMFWWKIGSMALLAVAASGLLFHAAIPGRAVPRGSVLLAGLAVALVMALGLWRLATAPDGLMAAIRPEAGPGCCASILAASVPPLLAGLWWLRRAAPVRPRHAAALVGLLSGALGATAFALHCPHDLPAYVMVWYGLSIALTSLVAGLIAPRLIRW